MEQMATGLKDQAERDRIVQDLDRNLIVHAGAGAGKTHALVDRMVAFIVEKDAPVEHMAAITFTRKAAGEMRDRFFKRLRIRREEVHTDTELGPLFALTDEKRIDTALDRIDQCFIGTIHSFCARLLRERPIEAGLPPDFTEIDEFEEIHYMRAAWSEYLQHCYLEDDPLLAGLEDLGVRPGDLTDFFFKLYTFPDLKLVWDPAPAPKLESAAQTAIGFVEQLLEVVPEHPKNGSDKLMQALFRSSKFLRHHGLNSDADRVKLLNILKTAEATQYKWDSAGKTFSKRLQKELLPAFLEHTVEPALKQWRMFIYPKVAEFTLRAVGRFEEQRRLDARMTFNDLLLRTRDLLRDHPGIRAYFQEKYRHIFVDEFQDTDPIQAEILFYLTGDDVEERSWKALNPRPGSLFLVGDEKQSIYRFRRADVEVFRFVSDRIRETGGAVVPLTTSFRSYGRLCQWLNGAFSKLFGEADPEVQAVFGPLDRYRAAGLDDRCVRRLVMDKVSRNVISLIVEEDATRIADFIAAAIAGKTSLNAENDRDGSEGGHVLARKASPGDFLILLRRRMNLQVYARALEKRGIPYDVSGAGTLNKSDELRLLVQLLEAVFNPDDPVALVAYLRGPLVGLSDAELYEFKTAYGRFDYWRPVPDRLEPALRDRITSAFERLKSIGKETRRLSAGAAIERLLEEIGLVGFGVLRESGSSRAGNLLKVLSLVRKWENAGKSWSEIIDGLRFLLDELSEEEEMTLETGQSNVVRLMNLHIAKGLEAPVVFLAYDTAPKWPPSFHVSRVREEALVVPAVVEKRLRKSETIAEPVGWSEKFEPKEAAFLEAEELRLLYVAATRARNLLVVSQYGPDPSKSAWAALNPFLQDVPELKIPSTPVAQPEAEFVDVQRQQGDRRERIARIKAATYDLTSVTRMRDEVEPWAASGAAGGYGKEYGNAIHRLFEMIVRGGVGGEGELITALLESEGAISDLEEKAHEALDGFRASEVWSLVRKSERVLTEVPFAEKLDGTVINGTIDLIAKTDGGWILVDYKTDRITADEELEKLAEHYAPQISGYVRHWEGITGEKVIRAGLWLTDRSVFHELHAVNR